MATSRLPDRAVHVFFLRELAKEKVPAASSGCLGELKTFQVVKQYVQPSTAKFKMNFIDCLCQGRLGEHQPKWCLGGTLSNVPGTPRAMGPTTYFVSHAWSYTFSALIALVEMHYASLPKTDKGKTFIPVFYWVDILAVTQHFTGKFTDHPDSDFPGVICASKAVLFTMYPWRSPIAPTRVWCLFEALTAVESEGVELEVLLDTQGSKDTAVQTVLTVASSVDVRSAQATVAADKSFIMGRIRDGVGVEAFNSVLRKRLWVALISVAFKKATANRDSDALVQLIKGGGARSPDGTLDVLQAIPYGTVDHVASLLGGLTSSNIPRRLVLAGNDAGLISEYTGIYFTTTPIWVYMPLPGKVLAAVGKLLLGQTGGGSAAEKGAGAVGSSRTAVGAGRVSGTGSSRLIGGVGVGARNAPQDGGGEKDFASNAVGLQELWLSTGPLYDRYVSYRPAWASKEYSMPEEDHLKGVVDPAWYRRELELQRTVPDFGSQRHKYFNEHHEKWKGGQLAKLQAAAEAREAAERPAKVKQELKERTELWTGLAATSTLTFLGLHRGMLSSMDVAALGRALRQNRTIRVLQGLSWPKERHAGVGKTVTAMGLTLLQEPAGVASLLPPVCNVEPEEDYVGGSAAMSKDLLAAGLGSRSMERLLLTPVRPALLDAVVVPGAAAWDMGGGAALQELALAPIALAPGAVKQLAELLASMPALKAGVVDVRKAGPRAPLPRGDYKVSPRYQRSEKVTSDPPWSEELEGSDLAAVMKLRASCGAGSGAAAAAPFVATLTHFLAANAGAGAVAAYEAKDAALVKEAEEYKAENEELLLHALQAAPAEYAKKAPSRSCHSLEVAQRLQPAPWRTAMAAKT